MQPMQVETADRDHGKRVWSPFNCCGKPGSKPPARLSALDSTVTLTQLHGPSFRPASRELALRTRRNTDTPSSNKSPKPVHFGSFTSRVWATPGGQPPCLCEGPPSGNASCPLTPFPTGSGRNDLLYTLGFGDEAPEETDSQRLAY